MKKLIIILSIFIFFFAAFVLAKNYFPQKFIYVIQKIETKQSQKRIIAYKKYVNGLPKNKVESIIDAKNAYFKIFSYKDAPKYRDQAFKIFKDFNFQLIEKINENFDLWSDRVAIGENADKSHNFEDLNKDSDKVVKKIYIHLNKNGLALRGSECQFYIAENFDFQYKEFSKYLSPEWQEYLKYRAKESREGYLEDAGIIIPWDEIRNRLIFWDNFIIKYPKFSESEEIKSNIKNYFYFYLNGVDNSPLADWWETDKIKPEIIKSYENFIKYNKNSRFYPIVLNYYELLKRNKFTIKLDSGQQNEMIVKFMESNKISLENAYPSISGVLVIR